MPGGSGTFDSGVRGRLDLTLGPDHHPGATPGCWMHLSAGLPHSVRAVEPSVMVLTMLPTPDRSAQPEPATT